MFKYTGPNWLEELKDESGDPDDITNKEGYAGDWSSCALGEARHDYNMPDSMFACNGTPQDNPGYISGHKFTQAVQDFDYEEALVLRTKIRRRARDLMKKEPK